MRVVLVGPSPNISGLKLGSLIDSYDVVVRVNASFLATRTHPEDYGERIDTLYYTNDITRCNLLNYEIKEGNMDKKIKYITTWQHIIKGAHPIPFPHTSIFDTKSTMFHTKINNYKNTGTKAALHILIDPNVTELFIIGFSFHLEAQPYVMGTIKDIYPQTKKIDFGKHAGGNEIDYFRKVIMDDPRVKLHETVVKAMNDPNKDRNGIKYK
jgi:hypothetical protein